MNMLPLGDEKQFTNYFEFGISRFCCQISDWFNAAMSSYPEPVGRPTRTEKKFSQLDYSKLYEVHAQLMCNGVVTCGIIACKNLMQFLQHSARIAGISKVMHAKIAHVTIA